MIDLKDILREVSSFVPSVWGIIVVSEDGLPIDHAFTRALNVDDPLIVAGLLSSATGLLENLMKELADSSTDLLYAQGDKISILVGRVCEGYLAFLASPDTKLGPLLMEFKKYSRIIEENFKKIFKGEQT
ncbi:MAG: hypothetical protein GXO39_08620 [Thermotogae bacterium]|nr:hypothetical protein [Thermotogota bacterium]